MTESCPDCGSAVEYTVHSTRVRSGACASCGHAFTVITEVAGAVPVVALTADGEDHQAAEASERPARLEIEGPTCRDCGSALAFEPTSDGHLVGVCASCDSRIVFVPQGERASTERNSFPRRGDRSRPPRDSGPDGPPARPCRQCGAPLRFTTNDEGFVTGECDSCGNRFTLPPRREGGRFGGGGFKGARGRPRTGFRPRDRDERGPPRFRRFGDRAPPRSDDRRDDRRRRRTRDE